MLCSILVRYSSAAIADEFASILTSFHLWLSPYLRPPSSRFTRSERITVLAVFLFLYS